MVDSDVKGTHVFVQHARKCVINNPQRVQVVIPECAGRGELPIGLMRTRPPDKRRAAHVRWSQRGTSAAGRRGRREEPPQTLCFEQLQFPQDLVPLTGRKKQRGTVSMEILCSDQVRGLEDA